MWAGAPPVTSDVGDAAEFSLHSSQSRWPRGYFWKADQKWNVLFWGNTVLTFSHPHHQCLQNNLIPPSHYALEIEFTVHDPLSLPSLICFWLARGRDDTSYDFCAGLPWVIPNASAMSALCNEKAVFYHYGLSSCHWWQWATFMAIFDTQNNAW